MARTIPEWIGKTDDSVPPPRVKQRILERQDRLCGLTKAPIPNGITPDYDHIIPLRDGGENRESNLQAVMPIAHKKKTAREAKERAKIDAIVKRSYGLNAPKRPIPSRDLPQSSKPRRERHPEQTGMTEIQRRYGIQ
jgi:5-methylcytosine-specific restriction endonuclease McrA